ncbi:MAG: polyphosphate polymerase domain-containing protein [Firmicutes bacterium]|nr:polyphosphate polymerase domain-containing protein [Bacillota bacterium]
MELTQYRYELKFLLNPYDAAVLKKQLALVCSLDPHSLSDELSYEIRSLYFDDAKNSAFDDKVNGERTRKKYRIRMYNTDTDFIRLECKHKDDIWTYKQEQTISLDLCKKLIKKDHSGIEADGPLLRQFLLDARLFGLKPAVIVEYKRLAFTYPVSDVRITFDEDIRSGRYEYDFFKKNISSFSTDLGDQVELEVKCNEFIPDHILAILGSVDKCRQALSKYALAYQIK